MKRKTQLKYGIQRLQSPRLSLKLGSTVGASEGQKTTEIANKILSVQYYVNCVFCFLYLIVLWHLGCLTYWGTTPPWASYFLETAANNLPACMQTNRAHSENPFPDWQPLSLSNSHTANRYLLCPKLPQAQVWATRDHLTAQSLTNLFRLSNPKLTQHICSASPIPPENPKKGSGSHFLLTSFCLLTDRHTSPMPAQYGVSLYSGNLK